MPDTLGHSVGIERYELLAKLAGNEVILQTVCNTNTIFKLYNLFD